MVGFVFAVLVLPAGIILLALAAIVLGYTVLGRFLAVSLTDVVQALLMLVSLVVVPTVIGSQGGLGPTAELLRALDPATVDPFVLSIGVAIGFLGIGFGSPGNPHIIVRYLSIRNPDDLRSTALVGTI